MRFTTATVLASLWVSAHSSFGQSTYVGTASFVWELSADRGTTWTTGLLEVPQNQSRVDARVRVSWSADAGTWFNATGFDAVWSGDAGAGPTDSLITAQKEPDFEGAAQNLAATRFGTLLKIDDSRDTLPPGEGQRAILVGQVAPTLGGDNSDNPAQLLRFSFQLDGSLGTRTILALPIALTGGNSTDRFVRIFTTFNGAGNFPLVTQFPATLRVIPGPASLTSIVIVALPLARRRR